jgi:hypothetical protein
MDDFSSIFDGIEDEIDCAFLNDDGFNNSLEVLNNPESVDKYDVTDADMKKVDEVIDVNFDHSEIPFDNTMEDVDATDLLAAERDLIANPFEDDEIIEASIGDDDIDNMDASDVTLDELADE